MGIIFSSFNGLEPFPKLRFKDKNGNDYLEWKTITIKDALKYEQPQRYIVKIEDYNNSYPIPVLTANKAFILGYTKETEGIYNKGDTIIYDDFTMDLKFVKFNFKVKSSAIKILTSKNGFNLFFIFCLLTSLNLKPQGHQRSYISILEPMKVWCPTFEEQQKIADFLSLVDQRIEKQRQLVESLKKYKRGALSRVFNDVLETVKLSDISNFISSTRTLSTTLNSNKGIYPVYDAAGIAGYIDHYDIDSDYITIVKDGSGVGRLQKCDKKSSFIGTLGALVAKNCTTDFLYAVLQTIDFSKFVTGMAIPHIYYRDYKSNLLPFPSEEKQRAISQFFKKFDKCIENETQKLSNMLKYKQGLLQQIFI